MKLTKLQKHYQQYFKEGYHFYKPKNNSIWDRHPFNAISTKLMRTLGFELHPLFESNDKIKGAVNQNYIIDYVVDLKISNTNLCLYNDRKNKIYNAFILNPSSREWHDIYLNGETYELMDYKKNKPTYYTPDWNQTFTEEFLFQQSIIHNEDLLQWQKVYKILKVLNNIKEPTIAKIYAEFIKC